MTTNAHNSYLPFYPIDFVNQKHIAFDVTFKTVSILTLQWVILIACIKLVTASEFIQHKSNRRFIEAAGTA